MAKSYENINYSLRPGKSIERKMFVELFQKLSAFYPLPHYQYVGFGSTYFSDFLLYHKALGINNLISIEGDVKNENRFKFNVPFSCVKLHFNHSNEILPLLKMDETPTILWLDYDSVLLEEMFEDIETFVSTALEGSILLVTVNANQFNADTNTSLTNDELIDFRYNKLKANVGEDKIPLGITGSSLNKKGTPKVYDQIIVDEINSHLSARNGSMLSSNPNRFNFKKLVNIVYQDGAQMLTVGGIITKEHQATNLAAARFEELNFFNDSDVSTKIETPNLTYKEISYLTSLLPSHIDLTTGVIDNMNQIDTNITNISDILPLKDVKKFSKVYRYFPTFTESNI